MIPSGFFNSFDEKTKRLVMLYFSMVSKAAIARVSVDIVFGFKDITILIGCGFLDRNLATYFESVNLKIFPQQFLIIVFSIVRI